MYNYMREYNLFEEKASHFKNYMKVHTVGKLKEVVEDFNHEMQQKELHTEYAIAQQAQQYWMQALPNINQE